MRYIEKHPMIMIVIGIIGISLSAIFVKYSTAPSQVTAAFRMLWTVVLMTPVVVGRKNVRKEFQETDRKTLGLCALSGLCLAAHFVLWFESLRYTSVASSTTIVCTEVIWVSLGFCLFMKGKISRKAIGAIAVAIIGSVLIAYSDSEAGALYLYGDLLALAGAMIEAVYTLIGRVVREKVSTTIYTYTLYAVCAVVLVIACLVQGYGLFQFGSASLAR